MTAITLRNVTKKFGDNIIFKNLNFEINEGEVITIPTGGAPNLKYYKGKFVDSGNILLSAREIHTIPTIIII